MLHFSTFELQSCFSALHIAHVEIDLLQKDEQQLSRQYLTTNTRKFLHSFKDSGTYVIDSTAGIDEIPKWSGK